MGTRRPQLPLYAPGHHLYILADDIESAIKNNFEDSGNKSGNIIYWNLTKSSKGTLNILLNPLNLINVYNCLEYL